ncbi:MAG TPA: helix-turn-helix domain-containing protein [Methanotrichaceae archaeon]|nr:helix-turn-helix domain-containing protein [Methanotrichaceae archaeon]
MKTERKPTPQSPEEMAMIHHALENPIRRNMIILMNEGKLTVPEIAQAVGPNMLDYHLHRLELAGLIELKDDEIILTESGKAYGGLVKLQREKGGADKV